MSFKKNFRGATTYAAPASDKYRDEYDRIFGKKDPAGPQSDPAPAAQACDHPDGFIHRPITHELYCPRCQGSKHEIEALRVGATSL